MENKKLFKKYFAIILLIILVIIVGILLYYERNYKKTTSQENVVNNKSSDAKLSIKENILLYDGMEIKIGLGIQDVSEMKIGADSNKKYNTTYYNYENGKYEGSSQGTFGEEIYEGFSVVQNVKKIAMTQQYKAIPREYKEIYELPKELQDMSDYSSVNIHQIDLDGDGKTENLLCYTVNYKKDQIGDGEPKASSGIILLDCNYKKIEDLVTLENGFWANQKQEENKVFLSLNDVDYIDVDNDAIMEIIIKIPTYEGTKISIVKYEKGKVKGEINYQASLLP